MVPDFFKEYKYDGRPFLLAGMGPSFSRIHDYPIHQYNILGINKVVREIPVEICHIIDHYIIDKVRKEIESNAKILLMPYYPHFGFRPHPMLTLEQSTSNIPGNIKPKIMGYNLATFIPINNSPIIFAKYFNAEASLNIIANLGCKVVKAIGIDGGSTRAEEFSDHGPCDPRGFDLQWDNMSKTIVKYNLDYSNLDGSPLNPKLQELIDAKHNSQETNTTCH